ncbi:histidine kinase N-terminal 7TM domain-containing protein [Haladaptatus caseinilyticus]|uniref:histidine kinase N-terminal 7TM domain-containing protein n=1 Tax=Haladaptatus caseinilyticus TaxID=2993314 RepID=UPI00224B1CC5|nr:histidine kinase N-terminal 7TM domain-containing protein [Haladaptatus caseinilyticus]
MFGPFTPAGGIVLCGTTVGGAVSFVLARHGWSNRDVPGSASFASLMLVISGWCFLSLLFFTASARSQAILWGSLIGICASTVPILWLSFTLEYTGRDDWLTPATMPLIWAEPVMYTAVSLLTPEHGFVNESATLVSIGGLTTLSVSHGPTFYFHLAYLFVVIVSGFTFLIVFLAQADRLYRRQTVVVVLAGLFPLVGTGASMFVASNAVLDLTPIFFAGGGMFIALALFRYDFLDVTPLASEVVLSEMEDPVIVVSDGQIVEYNPMAVALFDSQNAIGEDVESVLPGLLDAVWMGKSFSPSRPQADGGTTNRAVDGSDDVTSSGFVDDPVAETAVYDPRLTPIYDHHGIRRGDILVLREITDRKHREETLRALQSATRRLMDSKHEEEIAQIAVETADEVLDHPYSAIVFPDESETILQTVAMTGVLADSTDGEITFHRADDSMWDVFESGVPGVHESPTELSETWYNRFSVGCLLLFPLGEHGVLGVGSDPKKRAFTDNDRRFAEILATTTESALDRARRETELRESQAMVEKRNEQIEFFNGVLRHDILNGITVINGNLELLDEHVGTDGKPHLETVREWSEDIGKLTQKVRSASRTITDAESMPLTTLSLSETLSRKATKIRTTYPNVEVEADIEHDLFISGNELLGEVLENVLLNAVEHNDQSFPTLTVRAWGSDEIVRVEIEDDGPGIPDGMKSEVFDRNVTSASSGSIGFGLYFVRVMMDRYDGDVWFEDANDGGTVAVLTFPVEPPDAPFI